MNILQNKSVVSIPRRGWFLLPHRRTTSSWRTRGKEGGTVKKDSLLSEEHKGRKARLLEERSSLKAPFVARLSGSAAVVTGPTDRRLRFVGQHEEEDRRKERASLQATHDLHLSHPCSYLDVCKCQPGLSNLLLLSRPFYILRMHTSRRLNLLLLF
jgi:hypothetical protein